MSISPVALVVNYIREVNYFSSIDKFLPHYLG
jgi:hypothetical protein